MPKGQTNQPLTIMVTPEMLDKLLIQTLINQGHSVSPLPAECVAVDLVLGVNCHMFTDDMLDKPGTLLAAMKAARKRKKNAKT